MPIAMDTCYFAVIVSKITKNYGCSTAAVLRNILSILFDKQIYNTIMFEKFAYVTYVYQKTKDIMRD